MKRVISFIMVLVMLIGVMPIPVGAEEAQETTLLETTAESVPEEVTEASTEPPATSEAAEETQSQETVETQPQETIETQPQVTEETQVSEPVETEPEVPEILSWEKYRYTLLADGSASICGFTGTPADADKPFLVEIPDAIQGVVVTQIADRAFAGNEAINAVLLPETIQVIGSGAFENCKNLKVIAFCGDAPTFGETLVKACDKLEEIYVLEGQDLSALEELLENDLEHEVQFQCFENEAELFALFEKLRTDEPTELQPDYQSGAATLYAAGAPLNAAELVSRMNAVVNGKYGVGHYFRNVESRPCYFSDTENTCHSHHGGDYAKNDGYCNCKVATADIAGTTGGIQCFGYARYVFYQLFGQAISNGMAKNEYWYLTSTKNVNIVGQSATTASESTVSSILSRARLGDFIQARTSKGGAHSMIVYAVSDSEVTVLECNHAGQCYISTRSISWKKFAAQYPKFTVYTSTNHPGGAVSSCNCSDAYAGEYICTTSTANLTIRSGHGSGYSQVGTIPPGATVHVSKASGTGVQDWGHVEYNGVSGYASMAYLKKAETAVDIAFSYWLSLDPMGSSVSSVAQGNKVYLCYRIYDKISGKNLNEIRNLNYSVTETIYYPDQSVAQSYTYGCSDNNWIGAICRYPGNYTYKLELTGDLTSTISDTFTVASNPKKVHVSANSVTLTLGESETQAINVRTSGYHPNPTALNWSCSNNFISCAWGEWDETGWVPLTITAKESGSAVLTVAVKDKNSGVILDSCNINVSVGQKVYAITYDANGGSGAPSEQSKYHGVNLSLSPRKPTGKTYTVSFNSNGGSAISRKTVACEFLSWNTRADGSGTSYSPGDTYSANASAKMYAQWESAELGSTEKPTRDGYTFVGWYDSAAMDGNGVPVGTRFTASSQISKNTTLYAIWIEVDTLLYGDYNRDGIVDYSDALAFNRYLLGKETLDYDMGEFLLRVDLDRDGVATENDLEYINKLRLGQMTQFEASAGYMNTAIDTMPKTQYAYGENLDTSRLSIYIRFGDVAYNISEDLSLSGYDPYQLGKQTVFVRFHQFSTSYSVTVQKQNYTITYNTNGGSGSFPSQAKSQGAELTLSTSIPTKFGYNFDGWATSKMATAATYQPGDRFTTDADTTLYAVWKQPTTISTSGEYLGKAEIRYPGVGVYYKITPSVSTSYRIYGAEEVDNKIRLYSANGTLIGSDDDSGGNRQFQLDCSLTSGQVYYIYVQLYSSMSTGSFYFVLARGYSVDYNANGGSGAPPTDYKYYGMSMNLSSTIPTRTGYTFLGWATTSSAVSATYQPGGAYTGYANITLYAVWKLKEYTIRFDANGGTGAPESQLKQHGISLTLSSVEPLRTGYRFLGWAATPSSTSIGYRAGSTFNVNADTTLYAVWKLKEYTISYNANGGSGAPSSQKKQHGNPLELSMVEPTRTGYRFLGWSITPTAVSQIFQPGDIFSADADTVLYALWEENEYIIHYDANGGSGAPDDQITYHGVGLVLSEVRPARTGYAFLGWALSANAKEADYQPNSIFYIDSDTVLYAVWEQNAIVVSRIDIASAPYKTIYQVGEHIDTEGLTIRVTYPDGSIEVVSQGFAIDNFSSSEIGTRMVTVSYGSNSAIFPVYIVPANKDYVKIIQQPEKNITLTEGENKCLTVVADREASFQWFVNLKPMEGAAEATCSLASLKAGLYQVHCEVTSNDITIGSQLVQVVVKPASSSPISMTKAYLVLHVRESTQLFVKADSDALLDMIQWSTEDATGIGTPQPIVRVGSDGTITAVRTGTAYVTASVTVDGVTYSDRCRVDVTAQESSVAVQGAQLGTTALTTELFKTDYASFDVVLLLKQNESRIMSADAISPDSAALEDNGVAITSARFEDEQMDALFALAVKDDRTLLVVPRQTAVDNPNTVGKSYSSKVIVNVGGERFTTDSRLELTVMKTMPTLKAEAMNFNSFYTGQNCPITITGATVTGISRNTAKDTAKTAALPTWLTLSNGVLALTDDAPAKSASGSAYVLVETEEWAMPIAVTVSVKLAYKAPGLKLSASSVTFANAGSGGVSLKLLCSGKADTLSSLNVSGIRAPEGFDVRNFNRVDGSFTLVPNGAIVPGTKDIVVSFSDTGKTVTLELMASTKAVTLSAKPGTVTLNSVVGDSAVIQLTASPADYQITAPTFRLTDSSGAATNQLDFVYSGGTVTIKTNASTRPGATYQLYVAAPGSKEAVITVKTLAEKSSKPTLSAKVTGTIDLSFPESYAVVIPSFRNYNSGLCTLENWTVTESKGKTNLGDVTNSFEFGYSGGQYRLLANGDLTAGNTYMLTMTFSLADGSTYSCSVKIPVKRTPVKLKLSTTTLSLNKSTEDMVYLDLQCLTKNYALRDPLISAPENLFVSYLDGQLFVAVNEKTEYGATYRVSVRATQYDMPVTLTVKIPAENKSAVTAALKAAGQLDVVRDSTAITVTPTYKNVLRVPNTYWRMDIYSSADNYAIPVTGLFHVEKTESGSFAITRAEGAQINAKLKYRAVLTSKFVDVTVVSAPVALKIIAGSAKITAQTSGSALYAVDKNSRADFRLIPGDANLNKILSVRIKNQSDRNLFELFNYGNGSYAVGFKDGEVNKSLLFRKTAISLPLEVALVGNGTPGAIVSTTLKVAFIPYSKIAKLSIYGGIYDLTGKITNLDAGCSRWLTAKTEPADTLKQVTWKSSNNTVATVDPETGIVEAHKVGKAVITCTANDGSRKSASMTLNVTAPILVDLTIRQTFCLGDTLDARSLMLKAFYQSGWSKQIVEGFTCTPTVLNEVGTQTVTVTYGGMEKSFQVEVLDFYELSAEVENVSGEGYNEDGRVNWVLYVTGRYTGNYTNFSFQTNLPVPYGTTTKFGLDWNDALNGRGGGWDYGCTERGFGEYHGGHAFILPDNPMLAGRYFATLSFGDVTKTVYFTLVYNGNYTSGTGWSVTNVSWR